MKEVRVTTRRRWQALGWSTLIVGTFLLASLLTAGVTNGTGGVLQAAPTRGLPSSTTGALVDNDARARFLASVACDPSLRVCSEW
jgi:hypothetical protein